MARQVDGEPGVKRDVLARLFLPLDDAIQKFFGPALIAYKVVRGEQDLPDTESRQVVQFRDNVIGGKVMGPVVVGQDPDITEFAKEGTTARNFEHGTVITLVGCINERTVKALSPGDVKSLLRFADLRQARAIVKVLQKVWEGFFAVTDENVIEHQQLADLAGLIQRPAHRPADYEN